MNFVNGFTDVLNSEVLGQLAACVLIGGFSTALYTLALWFFVWRKEP